MIKQKIKTSKGYIEKKTYRDKHNPDVIIEEYDVPAGIDLSKYISKFKEVKP